MCRWREVERGDVGRDEDEIEERREEVELDAFDPELWC
jgi:hypothetical protein